MSDARKLISQFARILDDELTERANKIRLRSCGSTEEREAAAYILDEASWAVTDAHARFMEATEP